MSENLTKIEDLIDPEVMADMISAKLPSKIRVSPFAKVDTSLVGIPGDTITIPSYSYIGDAEDVAEGEEVTIDKMQTSTKKVKIKKAMKGTSITDEAVLSGYGNPVSEANNQLALAIASKVDVDSMEALQTATLTFEGTTKISYDGIVDAIDVFDEEINTEKAMFINPKQSTTLRKDANFISADKYPGNVIMSGEIGMIANTRIVSSKKVPLDEEGTNYLCPIIKLKQDDETEDELPAITIYLKRDVNVETERVSRKRLTEITADEFYAAALTNESKVVLAKFKK